MYGAAAKLIIAFGRLGLDGLGGTRPRPGELEPFDGRHPTDRLKWGHLLRFDTDDVDVWLDSNRRRPESA